jgi:dihydropteroate synthase-like protein
LHGLNPQFSLLKVHWYLKMPGYLFVTGKLAADSLRRTLEKMQPGFHYVLEVLDISVASLMSVKWIARRLSNAYGCEQVIIPGLCRGDVSLIQERVGVPVVRGPADLKDIPAFFGHPAVQEGYGEYHVKIMAEIVDAYRMTMEDIFTTAEYYRASGADIIDLGCPAGGGFQGVGRVVAELKQGGFTVSVDSFDTGTILEADEAGVDFLLSINSVNLHLAPRLKCKVVVIPDFGEGLESLERNAARLREWGVPYIMDPILDPINFGFVEALHRFYEIRRRYRSAEMLMGVGNLTELIDSDSIGINALMAGVLTELKIDYVLTTEVISWTRGAVRELDLARRLMYYANLNRLLPKHIDTRLVAVKDPPYQPYSEAELRRMQELVRDKNFRIFTDNRKIYVFNRSIFICGTDPDEIFAQLEPQDASHAFYLGRELERASLAVHLGKRYTQESNLSWGYLSERWDVT